MINWLAKNFLTEMQSKLLHFHHCSRLEHFDNKDSSTKKLPLQRKNTFVMNEYRLKCMMDHIRYNTQQRINYSESIANSYQFLKIHTITYNYKILTQ